MHRHPCSSADRALSAATTTKRSAARRALPRRRDRPKEDARRFSTTSGRRRACHRLGENSKLWRRVDGCGPELFSFDDAVKGAEAGLLDNAAVADGAQAAEGRWVAEKAGASSWTTCGAL